MFLNRGQHRGMAEKILITKGVVKAVIVDALHKYLTTSDGNSQFQAAR